MMGDISGDGDHPTGGLQGVVSLRTSDASDSYKKKKKKNFCICGCRCKKLDVGGHRRENGEGFSVGIDKILVNHWASQKASCCKKFRHQRIWSVITVEQSEKIYKDLINLGTLPMFKEVQLTCLVSHTPISPLRPEPHQDKTKIPFTTILEKLFYSPVKTTNPCFSSSNNKNSHSFMQTSKYNVFFNLPGSFWSK